MKKIGTMRSVSESILKGSWLNTLAQAKSLYCYTVQTVDLILPCTVTRIDVIFRYPDRVLLTHFVHRAKKVFSMGA